MTTGPEIRPLHCAIFRLLCGLAVLSAVMLAAAIAQAQGTEVPPTQRVEVQDMIALKDGSVIFGEVVEMTEGKLKVRTRFGADEFVMIKWSDVTNLSLSHPLPLKLKDGTTIIGTVTQGKDGTIRLKAESVTEQMTIALDSVTAINPPVKPPVAFDGNFTLGMSGANGNANYSNISGLAELTGRSESLRLMLIGRYIYGEADKKLVTRNSRGTIKLDFFLTKRFYIFTSAYFEQDTFQDLNLRTALSAGPGYQFIEKGDFANEYLKDMQLFAEGGIAYFNEDFKIKQDQTSTRLRLSAKWDWGIVPDKIALYHYNEFFPSISNTKDFYLTTDQGVVFNIIKNFVMKLQYTYRYNNNPPPGIKPADSIYLITFGYSLGK
jgi:putative salt-induced outer membrane protein YdiY